MPIADAILELIADDDAIAEWLLGGIGHDSAVQIQRHLDEGLSTRLAALQDVPTTTDDTWAHHAGIDLERLRELFGSVFVAEVRIRALQDAVLVPLLNRLDSAAVIGRADQILDSITSVRDTLERNAVPGQSGPSLGERTPDAYRLHVQSLWRHLTRHFVGRRDVISRVQEDLESPGFVIVGSAGDGKSALIAHLVDQLQSGAGWRDSTTCHVVHFFIRADTDDSSKESFLRWVNPQLESIAYELEATIRKAEGDEQTYHLLAQLVLSRLSSERQLVVLVDGLDEQESAEVSPIGRLLDALTGDYSTIVCTSRPSPDPQASVATYDVLRSFARIDLAALSTTDIEDLLALTDVYASPETVAAIAEVTRGEALYTRVLCEDLAAQETLLDELLSGRVPERVEEYFNQQLDLIARVARDQSFERAQWIWEVVAAAALYPGMTLDDIAECRHAPVWGLQSGLPALSRFLLPGDRIRLVHQRLQAAARLQMSRLDHTSWVDDFDAWWKGYLHESWPESTPLFLLESLVSYLRGRPTELAQVVTDSWRVRQSSVSGSQAAFVRDASMALKDVAAALNLSDSIRISRELVNARSAAMLTPLGLFRSLCIVGLTEQALALLSLVVDPERRARCVASCLDGLADQGASVPEPLRRLGAELSTDSRVAAELPVLALSMARAGEVDDALDALDRLVRFAISLDVGAFRTSVLLSSAEVSASIGRTDFAVELLENALSSIMEEAPPAILLRAARVARVSAHSDSVSLYLAAAHHAARRERYDAQRERALVEVSRAYLAEGDERRAFDVVRNILNASACRTYLPTLVESLSHIEPTLSSGIVARANDALVTESVSPDAVRLAVIVMASAGERNAVAAFAATPWESHRRSARSGVSRAWTLAHAWAILDNTSAIVKLAPDLRLQEPADWPGAERALARLMDHGYYSEVWEIGRNLRSAVGISATCRALTIRSSVLAGTVPEMRADLLDSILDRGDVEAACEDVATAVLALSSSGGVSAAREIALDALQLFAGHEEVPPMAISDLEGVPIATNAGHRGYPRQHMYTPFCPRDPATLTSMWSGYACQLNEAYIADDADVLRDLDGVLASTDVDEGTRMTLLAAAGRFEDAVAVAKNGPRDKLRSHAEWLAMYLARLGRFDTTADLYFWLDVPCRAAVWMQAFEAGERVPPAKLRQFEKEASRQLGRNEVTEAMNLAAAGALIGSVTAGSDQYAFELLQLAEDAGRTIPYDNNYHAALAEVAAAWAQIGHAGDAIRVARDIPHEASRARGIRHAVQAMLRSDESERAKEILEYEVARVQRLRHQAARDEALTELASAVGAIGEFERAVGAIKAISQVSLRGEGGLALGRACLDGGKEDVAVDVCVSLRGVHAGVLASAICEHRRATVSQSECAEFLASVLALSSSDREWKHCLRGMLPLLLSIFRAR
jgi:hypothetical protein